MGSRGERALLALANLILDENIYYIKAELKHNGNVDHENKNCSYNSKLINASESGCIQLNKPYKLSIKPNNVNIIRTYSRSGLFGICNQESKISLFDITNDNNYTLSLSDSFRCVAP
eukprot:159523_1